MHSGLFMFWVFGRTRRRAYVSQQAQQIQVVGIMRSTVPLELVIYSRGSQKTVVFSKPDFGDIIFWAARATSQMP